MLDFTEISASQRPPATCPHFGVARVPCSLTVVAVQIGTASINGLGGATIAGSSRGLLGIEYERPEDAEVRTDLPRQLDVLYGSMRFLRAAFQRVASFQSLRTCARETSYGIATTRFLLLTS